MGFRFGRFLATVDPPERLFTESPMLSSVGLMGFLIGFIRSDGVQVVVFDIPEYIAAPRISA